MNQLPDPGADGEALKQAMNELMQRVREDVQAKERLLAQDPQAAERAARLRMVSTVSSGPSSRSARADSAIRAGVTAGRAGAIVTGDSSRRSRCHHSLPLGT